MDTHKERENHTCSCKIRDRKRERERTTIIERQKQTDGRRQRQGDRDNETETNRDIVLKSLAFRYHNTLQLRAAITITPEMTDSPGCHGLKGPLSTHYGQEDLVRRHGHIFVRF